MDFADYLSGFPYSPRPLFRPMIKKFRSLHGLGGRPFIPSCLLSSENIKPIARTYSVHSLI